MRIAWLSRKKVKEKELSRRIGAALFQEGVFTKLKVKIA